MEKRIWSKPEMNEFAFAANEYVAACGDGGKTYKFTCDAPAGQLFYYTGLNVEDYPNADKWSTEEWDKYRATEFPGQNLLNKYHPCDETHTAEATSGFFWGFIDWFKGGWGGTGRNDKHDAGETVIVWYGNDEQGYGHATQKLDMRTWEIAKS